MLLDIELPTYITIEGNIGAGKTTLSRKLATACNRRLILETFSDNPFLPLFYQHPERYALPVELFFMAERHKQLQQELAQAELFSGGVVADYLFIKTLLFARNSLSGEEFQLFRRLFGVLTTDFPTPDLVVYLDRPLEALQANIAKRGRSYENDLQDEYLASIRQAYFDYFHTRQRCPVLIFELGTRDFVQDQQLYDEMVRLMATPHPAGISRYRFC